MVAHRGRAAESLARADGVWADRLGTTTDDVEYWCEEAAKKIAAFEARSKEAAAVS